MAKSKTGEVAGEAAVADSSLTEKLAGTQTAVPAGSESQAVSKPPEGTGQQPGKPEGEETYDWTKDDRYDRWWKKDPNGLYKSYRNIEKVYDPLKLEAEKLKSQVAELDAMFKEYGIKLDKEQLKEVLTEYAGYKNPDNPLIANGNYINQLLGNDLYKDKIVSFFQEIEKAEIERKYPNMGAEQRAKMIQLETEMKELKEQRHKEEQEKQYNQSLSEIDEGIAKCRKYAEAKGFAFTDEVNNKLLEHCKANNIPTKWVYATFIDLYNDELDKAAAVKIKQGQLQNLNKNKNTVTIPPGAAAAKAGSAGKDLRGRLMDIVRGTAT